MNCRLHTAQLSRKSFLRAMGFSAAALAAAGCTPEGQKDSSGGGKDTSDGSTKITFVLDYTPNTNHTGIYVAQEKGIFKNHGLEVEIQQPPADGADALIGSGGAQMGVSYQDFIANNLASEHPLPYTAVAAIIQHNLSGIMSRKDDNITRPREMQGHTYATWNLPVEQATVKSVVQTDGGDPETIKMVPYEVDDEVSGLKANMFDTVWVYEQWAVQNAEVQKFPYNYFSFQSINSVFDIYTPVIAANNDFAKAHPEVVKGFVAAVKEGYEYAVSNPSDAADILLKAVPELDHDLVHQSQKFLASKYIDDAESWGVIDKNRWAKFYQWLNSQNLLGKRIDVSAGFTTEYLK